MKHGRTLTRGQEEKAWSEIAISLKGEKKEWSRTIQEGPGTVIERGVNMAKHGLGRGEF